jgi:hypothetical protein
LNIQAVDPLTILGCVSLGIGITRWSYNTARWYLYPTKSQELMQEKQDLEKRKEYTRFKFHECQRQHPDQLSVCETFYKEWKANVGFRKEAR